MIHPPWLPSPLLYEPFQGNENAYIEAAYTVFCTDFKATKPSLNGKTVLHDGRFTYEGKEEAFWHLISKTSDTTGQRIPDFERCERLPWTRPLIEAVGVNQNVLTWKQVRRNKRNRESIRTAILLSHKQFAHIVFLQEQAKAFHLITTYYVSPGPKLDRYLKEYEEALKSKRPPLR